MKTTMQCDRCGGEMRLSEDGLRAKCPYCNHEILFRSPKGEALLLALARANSFRRDSRFSDAIREYKLITEENPEDAEAFWGLVLSTYGIEYVKDPRTSRYVPTCHRAVRGSILEDDNYLRAIGSATEEQRADYTEQANEIDRLQKDILRRTENAEDFDVFISFKSTDDMGNSTKDAQIARTIYDELVKRGFKTFFSDVTLNDMVFSDYEPVIFRALYSCKFFILVATKPEYVTAPWVENEWSRFEQRMEEEKLSGVACAVFDGRAVRDLPPFLRAQGIDLNRHAAGGYEVLLADSIERKLGRSAKSRSDEELKKQLEEQKRHQAEIEERLSSIGGGTSIRSLLVRSKQELVRKNYEESKNYCKQVLNIDPENGDAWTRLFLAETWENYASFYKQKSELSKNKNNYYDSNRDVVYYVNDDYACDGISALPNPKDDVIFVISNKTKEAETKIAQNAEERKAGKTSFSYANDGDYVYWNSWRWALGESILNELDRTLSDSTFHNVKEYGAESEEFSKMAQVTSERLNEYQSTIEAEKADYAKLILKLRTEKTKIDKEIQKTEQSKKKLDTMLPIAQAMRRKAQSKCFAIPFTIWALCLVVDILMGVFGSSVALILIAPILWGGMGISYVIGRALTKKTHAKLDMNGYYDKMRFDKIKSEKDEKISDLNKICKMAVETIQAQEKCQSKLNKYMDLSQKIRQKLETKT